MIRKLIFGAVACVSLVQCNTLKSDCEALAEREAQIAQEKPGDYYVGRRYYIPGTRFWGYLREPGKSWRTAKLVIMDERTCRQPDRGNEPPMKNAVFGTDNNVEYLVRGSYTGEVAFEPNTNQALPVFKLAGYELRNSDPGFLFVPSEDYDEAFVTIRPAIMPTPEACKAAQND